LPLDSHGMLHWILSCCLPVPPLFWPARNLRPATAHPDCLIASHSSRLISQLQPNFPSLRALLGRFSTFSLHFSRDCGELLREWGCVGVGQWRSPLRHHQRLAILLVLVWESEISVWQLRSCFCGAPSLTRGRACLLYMVLALASAVFLGSESLGTRRPYFTVSDFRLSFSSPPTTRRVTMKVFDPASTPVKVKVTLRLTVSQSVSLGVEPHLGLLTRYLVPFDSYGLVFFCGAPSLTRGRVCLLSESLPALASHLL
jgi:hypothetical protein